MEEELKAGVAKDPMAQNIEDITEAFQIKSLGGKTHIMAVIFDNERKNHRMRPLKCNHGEAIAKGYAYDPQQDAYHINCVDASYIGYMPFSYQLGIAGSGGWVVRIPLPESLIVRHMTAPQQKMYANLMAKYPKDRYRIEFIQTADGEIQQQL